MSELDQLREEVRNLRARVDKLEGKNPSNNQLIPNKPAAAPANQQEGGGNALAWVGGVIFALGLIFLVTYAVNQGWITPSAQVILGALAGALIASAGHFLHKKMSLQGSIITGVGVAVTYFSVYAGYALESYQAATGLTYATAATLLLGVIVAAALLALRQQSSVLLLETLILVYLTSFISSFDWFSTLYTSLFLVAFVVLTHNDEWREAQWIGLAAAFVFTLINLVRASDAQSYVLIAAFAAPAILSGVANKQEIHANLAVLASYVLALSSAFEHASELAVVAALISGSLYALNKHANNPAQSYVLAGVGYTALLIALELQDAWITVAWGILATTMLLIGLNSKQEIITNTGLGLLALAVAKLFLVDTLMLSEGLRVVAYITLGALLLAGSIAYKKYLSD